MLLMDQFGPNVGAQPSVPRRLYIAINHRTEEFT